MRRTFAHHRPMVYAGGGGSRVGAGHLADLGWGQLFSRAQDGPSAEQRLPFVLDNGAFAAWRAGEPFPSDGFSRRVERVHRLGLSPQFVVLPDVVADAPATLALSATWEQRLPATWRMYLALQDGMGESEVVGFAREHCIAGLFLGGTDRFKDIEASYWRGVARDLGIAFHYGRAGTPRKFEHAMLIRADSLDSTRLSRSQRDFNACRRLWLRGGHARLFSDNAKETAHA